MPQIDSKVFWNHTCVHLERGRKYRITVPPGQKKWRDFIFPCGPEGYTNFLVDLFKPSLRVRRLNGNNARFFSLIGTIGESTDHAFLIGNGTDYTASADGELVCFANDVPWAYGNNSGSMTIDVQAIPT